MKIFCNILLTSVLSSIIKDSLKNEQGDNRFHKEKEK